MQQIFPFSIISKSIFCVIIYQSINLILCLALYLNLFASTMHRKVKLQLHLFASGFRICKILAIQIIAVKDTLKV